MKGNISEIDCITGSNQDQEGGITVWFKDETSYECNSIDFLENGTFETN